MKKLILLLIVAVCCTASATTFTVSPGDLADGTTFANGQGGVPFGYDPDKPAPKGSDIAGPAGYETGCFWSDVQGSDPRKYTALRMSPKDIFGVSDVTISQLTNISYYTKNMDIALNDWQLKIYTEVITTGWYGHRFNFVRPQAADNDWHQYDTLGMAVDWIYGTGANSHPANTYLADLYSTYGDEKILFIDIIAGINSPAYPVDSYLDGVSISISGYEAANINLIPEPTTIALLGLGIAGLLRKKQ
ncbi:MAG: PEP-CTERM sorting domain-containing protein [Phycisphaerae bacterium]|jgi:hypothetical protein